MPVVVDSLPLSDRGLHYGDGLFETMAVQEGRVRLLDLHLARLARGAARLAIPLADADGLAAALARAAADMGDGVLKLILTRGSGGRGYLPPDVPTFSLIIQRYPPVAVEGQEGVTVRLCDLRLARQPLLAGLKHLNRLEQVLARAEWRDPAIAEGLMFDSEGLLIEGVASNVFLVREGQLLTPLLDQCGVAGVMRAHVIQRAAGLGMVVQETRLVLNDLLAADEVFLTNSLHGIRPVISLLGRCTWAVGPVTRALQARLWGGS
ncbi:MAG: aminodeoxychorismate lyase [Gammaproteobacteria bacterium]|nr:aminodeoxychorismate lyase [Gammaproteobacteria bacterium]